MPVAKLTDFSAAQQQLARLAKALAHPARIAILERLARQNTCISGDIAAGLPLARTTVTQHLRALQAAGLIRGDVDGLTVCYCLDRARLAQAQALFAGLFAQVPSVPACGPAVEQCAC